jgi:kynurenine 3-monooxygenase
MDTRVHYILNGCYTATLDSSQGQQQWACVLGVRDTDPPPKIHQLRLRTSAPTSHDVERLKAWVRRLAPAFAELLEVGGGGEEEYARFFGRRAFRGAVVSCARLNVEEWVLLLG